MAGTLRGTVTLALANGLYLVLLLLGGMIIPFDEMPSGLATIGELHSGRRAQHGDAVVPARRRPRSGGRLGRCWRCGRWSTPVAAARLFRWE